MLFALTPKKSKPVVNANKTRFLFAIFNFVYSILAIAIGVDFQLADDPYFAMLWFAIGLIYIIIGFVILLRRKKKIDFSNTIEEKVELVEEEDTMTDI